MTRPIVIDNRRALCVDELALRWKISESTVKRYLRAGKIFGQKLYSNHWVVSAAVVLRFERRYGFGPAPSAGNAAQDALSEFGSVIEEMKKKSVKKEKSTKDKTTRTVRSSTRRRSGKYSGF